MEYNINKGIGRNVEFNGLQAQYLYFFVGGLLAIFLLFVIFQAVFAWAEPGMDAIEAGFHFLGDLVAGLPLPDLLKSFLKDGLIGGVGSVIVFLPQIVILFFFILLLEDLGYMARATACKTKRTPSAPPSRSNWSTA